MYTGAIATSRRNRNMNTKTLTLEQMDAIEDIVIMREIDELLSDKNRLLELVADHVRNEITNYGVEQLLDLAEYHGVDISDITEARE